MGEGDGRVVNGQRGAHPRLLEKVARHLERPFGAPLPQHTRSAFAALQAVRPRQRPVILDSGCGTGQSTRYLAARFPAALVIGVDRSRKRLRLEVGEVLRQIAVNAWLLRAELGAFWMLALDAGWALQAHYLLYPNPYPKAAQFKRRWPAHPALPFLLALGGRVEIRSNWALYLEEMALAVRRASRQSVMLWRRRGRVPWSAFEEKYLRRGHAIYCCQFGSAGRWWEGPAWLRTAPAVAPDKQRNP